MGCCWRRVLIFAVFASVLILGIVSAAPINQLSGSCSINEYSKSSYGEAGMSHSGLWSYIQDSATGWSSSGGDSNYKFHSSSNVNGRRCTTDHSIVQSCTNNQCKVCTKTTSNCYPPSESCQTYDISSMPAASPEIMGCMLFGLAGCDNPDEIKTETKMICNGKVKEVTSSWDCSVNENEGVYKSKGNIVSREGYCSSPLPCSAAGECQKCDSNGNVGNKADGSSCTYSAGVNGVCSSGACISSSAPGNQPSCGNGKVESGEECDLGPDNGKTGKGCDINCKKVAPCNTKEPCKECDDQGNIVNKKNGVGCQDSFNREGYCLSGKCKVDECSSSATIQGSKSMIYKGNLKDAYASLIKLANQIKKDIKYNDFSSCKYPSSFSCAKNKCAVEFNEPDVTASYKPKNSQNKQCSASKSGVIKADSGNVYSSEEGMAKLVENALGKLNTELKGYKCENAGCGKTVESSFNNLKITKYLIYNKVSADLKYKIQCVDPAENNEWELYSSFEQSKYCKIK